MTAILPTRISFYDFLIEDTAPIDAILADSGNISIPQASILRHHGLQAIIAALLAYEQKYKSDSVLKKLFGRTAVKELRKYNAFNFITMHKVLQYGTTAEVLFSDEKTLKSVCHILADMADTSSNKARIVLNALTLIALRELAILADFSQLDANDLSEWFGFQHQFMQLDRSSLVSSDSYSDATEQTTTIKVDAQPTLANNIETTPHSTATYTSASTMAVLDNYDTDWCQIVGYKAPAPLYANPTDDDSKNNVIPNYVKAIGRMADDSMPNTDTSATQTLESSNNNDMLVFTNLDNIKLPHSRWLLQLGKVADIYISRKRLRIAPEPIAPPPRPLINLGLPPTSEASSIITADTPIDYSSPEPLWKNKTIYLILGVISVLSVLAVIKYQYQALPSGAPSTGLSASSNNSHTRSGAHAPSYDIAVMRLDDDEGVIGTVDDHGNNLIKAVVTADADNSDIVEDSDDTLDDDTLNNESINNEAMNNDAVNNDTIDNTAPTDVASEAVPVQDTELQTTDLRMNDSALNDTTVNDSVPTKLTKADSNTVATNPVAPQQIISDEVKPSEPATSTSTSTSTDTVKPKALNAKPETLTTKPLATQTKEAAQIVKGVNEVSEVTAGPTDTTATEQTAASSDSLEINETVIIKATPATDLMNTDDAKSEDNAAIDSNNNSNSKNNNSSDPAPVN